MSDAAAHVVMLSASRGQSCMPGVRAAAVPQGVAWGASSSCAPGGCETDLAFAFHVRRPSWRAPCLASCSCEGCSALRDLPPVLAGTLPLRSLNLLHSGVARLPLAARGSCPGKAGGNIEKGADSGEQRVDAGIAGSSGASAGSCFLSHLTELRWGAAEWEAAGGGTAARRWVGSAVLAAAAFGPDLSPVAQATGLRVLQLAHVPAGAEAQLAELRARLLLLARLQVNSAVLLG